MQRTQPSVLARLARVNPLSVFLGTLVLALIALFTPGLVGAVLLLALAGGLAALLSSTWSVQPGAVRLIRVLVLALLVAAALTKIF
jgi:hypothetical protein